MKVLIRFAFALLSCQGHYRESSLNKIMQNNEQTRAFFCRNTPVLLTAITGCLLACNQFTPGNEPPEIRRQGTLFYKECCYCCSSVLSFLSASASIYVASRIGMIFSPGENSNC